jgi:hypothetical protein
LRGCVSYFTLRASLILKETIKDLYKRLIMKAAVCTRRNAVDVDARLRAS